uniref:Endoplasmic reticulum vesicle transporter C-terminal domain-containing protein n=1 Tax=Rhizophora mucronata TaxID=61149 RepID=A0A2P2M8G7_RHIMU
MQITHKIYRLAFGEYFPGVVNPLDGVQWTQEAPNGMYQYFIKVVPTVYSDVNGNTIQSNQVRLHVINFFTRCSIIF